MKQARGYLEDFAVEGVGAFPIDMLRYDQAWPATEADSGMIPYCPGESLKRRVNLRRFVHAAANDRHTYVRWSSFGWKVV